jgi:hypothetical protein
MKKNKIKITKIQSTDIVIAVLAMLLAVSTLFALGII